MSKPQGALSELSASRLRDLLGIAVGSEDAQRSSLPGVLRTIDDKAGTIEALLRESDVVGDLTELLDPSTPPERLLGVKRWAKRRFEKAAGRKDQAIVMLLYHMSIAAAFGFHGECISARPMNQAVGLYEDLSTVLDVEHLRAPFVACVERHAQAKANDTSTS